MNTYRGQCGCGQPAVARRRRPTSVSRWGWPEPVCARHRDEADDLAERCALGTLAVDRAVNRDRPKGVWLDELIERVAA